MDLRGRDDGESECCAAMVRIGVERIATSLPTKVGRIPFGVSSRDRQIIHLDKGRQTMKGLSLWCALDPIHLAFWLLASIAQGRQAIILAPRVLLSRRLKGLSGINGNIYVPFLGGLGAAMPPGYPVRGAEMRPSYPAGETLACARSLA